MIVYVTNFFFTKKKKLQKEVTLTAKRLVCEPWQLDCLCRLIPFSEDKFVKTKPRVRAFWRSRHNAEIFPLFLQIYLGQFDLTFCVIGLAHLCADRTA